MQGPGTWSTADEVDMADPRLRSWWIVRRFSRTHQAEREHLKGQVYGDHRWPDGTLITTSAVVSRDSKTALTASGRRYALDAPREHELRLD
jgi:hypothetical protein